MSAALLLLLASRASAHGGHLTDTAWRACDAISLGGACSFENAAGDQFIGSCREMSGELICVRNRPIVYAAPVGATGGAPDTASIGASIGASPGPVIATLAGLAGLAMLAKPLLQRF